jgi:hypothetical protein
MTTTIMFVARLTLGDTCQPMWTVRMHMLATSTIQFRITRKLLTFIKSFSLVIPLFPPNFRLLKIY